MAKAAAVSRRSGAARVMVKRLIGGLWLIVMTVIAIAGFQNGASLFWIVMRCFWVSIILLIAGMTVTWIVEGFDRVHSGQA